MVSEAHVGRRASCDDRDGRRRRDLVAYPMGSPMLMGLSFRPRPKDAWRNLPANGRRLPFAARCLDCAGAPLL